jgi:hypothetical protein
MKNEERGGDAKCESNREGCFHGFVSGEFPPGFYTIFEQPPTPTLPRPNS